MPIPAPINITNTADFLFEVGSIMTTLFGTLFIATLLLTVTGPALHIPLPPPTIPLLLLFGLPTLNGLVFLYLSTQVPGQPPPE